MADISTYLAQILSAVYGEDVRGSIHDAIDIINKVGEVVLSTGTAVDSATSSSTGFYDASLYLNTDTYELWKCVGTDSWTSLGVLKGADGSPGTPGDDGNLWYVGTGISGKAINPTVYSGSGVANANVGDCYLNKSEGAVYHCTLGGNASTALWVFDFVLAGGGSSYTASNGINAAQLASDIIELDYGAVSGTNTTKPVTGKAVDDAIHDGTFTVQQNGVTAGSGSANQSTNSSANIVTDQWLGGDTPTTTPVSSGQFMFSGLDDTKGYAFEPYVEVSGASANKNPVATINTITGAGTASMSIIYDTDADNGAGVKLRIIK